MKKKAWVRLFVFPFPSCLGDEVIAEMWNTDKGRFKDAGVYLS